MELAASTTKFRTVTLGLLTAVVVFMTKYIELGYRPPTNTQPQPPVVINQPAPAQPPLIVIVNPQRRLFRW
jgi:hypothetical protein